MTITIAAVSTQSVLCVTTSAEVFKVEALASMDLLLLRALLLKFRAGT